MVDGEGVINAAADVDIDGIIDVLGCEADEDVGGGLGLNLSKMSRELGLPGVVPRATCVTSSEDTLRIQPISTIQFSQQPKFSRSRKKKVRAKGKSVKVTKWQFFVESILSLEEVCGVHLGDVVERGAHLPPGVPRAVGVLQGDAPGAGADGAAPRERDGRHRARSQDDQFRGRLHRVANDRHLLHLQGRGQENRVNGTSL